MQPTTAMMQAATAAVDLALPMLHPADAVLRNFFSANRALGQRDRAFVAETVFSVLRHKRLLEQLVAQPTPRKLVCAALIKVQGYGLGQIETFLRGDDRDWASLPARANSLHRERRHRAGFDRHRNFLSVDATDRGNDAGRCGGRRSRITDAPSRRCGIA